LLQRDRESGLCPKAHHVSDPYQRAPAVAFLHLAVDQAWLHLPPAHVAPSTYHLEPLSKVSRESIKVEIEAIAGEERDAARSQEQSQGVDDPMRRVLRAGAEIEHGQKLGAGVDGQPQPEHLGTAAPEQEWKAQRSGGLSIPQRRPRLFACSQDMRLLFRAHEQRSESVCRKAKEEHFQCPLARALRRAPDRHAHE